MKSRIGSLQITLDPITVAPVTPAGAYLGIAQALLPGAKLLATGTPTSAIALTLVSGHLLECSLKAFLSSRGVTEAELKKPSLRHNVSELWRRAAALGLPIASAPPPSVECLNGLHDAPFHLRYPMGFHGLVLPGTEPMLSQLEAVLLLVQQGLQQPVAGAQVGPLPACT
jgi:hypothetical protein